MQSTRSWNDLDASVNASIPRCIHVLPAHGKAVLHLSKREKDSNFWSRKKLRRIAIRVLIFYHEFANFLKEHESHEFHESGNEKEKVAIISDNWC